MIRFILPAYFVAALISPVMVNIRLSYIFLPLLIVPLLLRTALSGTFLKALHSKVLQVLLLFTVWMLFVVAFQYDLVFDKAFKFLAYWLVIFSFSCLIAIEINKLISVRRIWGGVNVVFLIYQVFLVITIIMLLVCVLEYFEPKLIYYLYQSREVGEFGLGARGSQEWSVPRLASTVGSTNGNGGVLSIMSLMLFSRWLILKGNRRGWVLLVLIFCLAGLFFSGSRGALLSFACGALFLIHSQDKLLKFIFFGAIVGVVLSITIGDKMIVYFTQAYVNGDVGGIAELIPVIADRLVVWDGAINRMYLDDSITLFFGHGLFERGLFQDTNLYSVHNIFLEALFSFGLVGLLIMVGFIGFLYAHLNQMERGTKVYWGRYREIYWFHLFVKSALLGMLVHSMVDDVLIFNTVITSVFIPLVAISLSLRPLVFNNSLMSNGNKRSDLSSFNDNMRKIDCPFPSLNSEEIK